MKIKELLSKASQDIFQYVSQFHQLYSKELSLVLYDTPNNELTFLFAKQKKHKKKNSNSTLSLQYVQHHSKLLNYSAMKTS